MLLSKRFPTSTVRSICSPARRDDRPAGICRAFNATTESIAWPPGVKDVEECLPNTFSFGEQHVPLETDHGSTGQRIGAWGRIEAHDTAACRGDNLERFTRFGRPGYPLALGPQDSPPAEQNFLFGGSHPQVVLLAAGDGSAKPPSVALEAGVWRRWTQRADGGAAADGWR